MNLWYNLLSLSANGEHTMKKTLITTLLLLLAFTLNGCARDQEEPISISGWVLKEHYLQIPEMMSYVSSTMTNQRLETVGTIKQDTAGDIRLMIQSHWLDGYNNNALISHFEGHYNWTPFPSKLSSGEQITTDMRITSVEDASRFKLIAHMTRIHQGDFQDTMFVLPFNQTGEGFMPFTIEYGAPNTLISHTFYTAEPGDQIAIRIQLVNGMLPNIHYYYIYTWQE